MKAWLLDSLGGLDRLRLGEAPDPIAGEGEVVLRVRYAALNPADRYLTEGLYPARPTFPHILGRDGIGTIEQVGPGVTGWRAGDVAILLRSDVGVNRPGTLAELVAIPADVIAPPPANWTMEESAGAALVYLTAYQALTQWDSLPQNATVLITGASGGVGCASIQLACAMGHRVLAMSRGDSKRDALLKLGAAIVLDPNDSQWRKKAREFLGGGRVDLAIDNIGGALLPEVVDTLGENGRVAIVGRLAGPVPQFNTATMFFRRIHMRGVYVGAYKPVEAQEAWRRIVELMAQQNARPLVDSIHDFAELREAFAQLERGPLGKVLVRAAPR